MKSKVGTYSAFLVGIAPGVLLHQQWLEGRALHEVWRETDPELAARYLEEANALP